MSALLWDRDQNKHDWADDFIAPGQLTQYVLVSGELHVSAFVWWMVLCTCFQRESRESDFSVS
jgi:hypothetical protein